MGGCVSTLLALARLDMGAQRFAATAVDLGELLAELRRSLVSLAREREWIDTVEPGELVHGDPDVLRIVVSNLLGNALYYAPRRSRVACRLERAPGQWRLVIENDAPELRPEDLRSLSEPFWRKDRARTDRNRSGLGLALSRALAVRTALQLDFELEDGVFRAILGGRDAAPAQEPVAAAAGERSSSRHDPGGAAG
jgi:signal transduction histidine kinase